MIVYAELAQRALELGAIQAKLLSTEDVVVEQRVTLKCRFGCPDYGRSHSCPPRVPTVADFRQALREYQYVLVVAFPTTATLAAEDGHGLHRARYDATTDPAVQQRIAGFYGDWEKSKAEAFAALLQLEKEAFNQGDPLTLVLRPGRCTLCEECDPQAPCRHPSRLRFSPEAVGVNLAATCQRANMDLIFPFDKRPSHIGMLMLG